MTRLAWVPALVLLCGTGCSLNEEHAGDGITLEVAVFEGGYGIEWHKNVARQYELLHPGMRINLWGDPRVDEKLKPRILRRNPPDLASCSLPVWKLIVAGKLHPLDETLDGPAYGQGGTWRESFAPGILDDFQYEGKAYALPSNAGAWVCWYDKRPFRRHGWQPPRTWGQFTALCEKMKAEGVAPIAFQGKYPNYAWATLMSIYQRCVPFDRWYAMQDLQPGAFTEPEFVHAARLLQEMASRYYQPGALAMTHTESQMEWVNGRAAMIFCGLWLKNEMKEAIPPGFEMARFPVPAVEGGQGDPEAAYGWSGEYFFVFADARHPKEAADFLKFLLSLPCAREYVRRLDTLSPVKGCAKGIPISPELQSAVDVLDRSSRMIDGAGEYRIFFSVMMPLARPGLITVAIFNFLSLWNEYLFGLVFLNSDRLKTLPLGLASISMQAQYKSDFGLLFAGLVIALLPTLLVYIVLQEKLTKGITAGAVKG